MKSTKRRIVIDLGPFKKAVLLAQVGIGNDAIAERTRLSNSQINYRAHLYKEEMGFQHGLRVTWRKAEHPLLNRVLDDVSGILSLEFERKFLPRFIHVPPQVSPKAPKAKKLPTVKDVVKKLKVKLTA